MSSIGWLAFDESENQKIQQTLKFYTDTEARNELGLGQIRDSISDHLFPGTSVLHSRLRYMLFIPWLFNILEDRFKKRKSKSNLSDIPADARKLEIDFIEALKRGTNEQGIIGVNVGEDLKYLPSGIYWSALKSWGVCNIQGSLSSLYHKIYMNKYGGIKDSFEIDSSDFSFDSIWNENVPDAPEKLLESVGFDLRKEEAEFFLGLLNQQHPNSFITYLVNSKKQYDCDYVWQIDNLREIPEKFQKKLIHGKIFSIIMQGASILYNLELSRRLRDQSKVDEYDTMMNEWCGELTDLEFAEWELDEFWSEISHGDHKIKRSAKIFVKRWLKLVVADPLKLKHEKSKAVNLIIERESKLKKKNSRFLSRSALNRWKGDSGIRKFDYRWRIAREHINDIANAI